MLSDAIVESLGSKGRAADRQSRLRALVFRQTASSLCRFFSSANRWSARFSAGEERPIRTVWRRASWRKNSARAQCRCRLFAARPLQIAPWGERPRSEFPFRGPHVILSRRPRKASWAEEAIRTSAPIFVDTIVSIIDSDSAIYSDASVTPATTRLVCLLGSVDSLVVLSATMECT